MFKSLVNWVVIGPIAYLSYFSIFQIIYLTYYATACCLYADIPFEVAYAMLKWVYTDRSDLSTANDGFLLNLLRASRRFRLFPLATRYV